jgi:hypothetical protein
MKIDFAGVSLLFITAVLATSVTVRSQAKPSTPEKNQAAILVGAGDIADCKDLSGAEATAKLVELIPGTVMVKIPHSPLPGQSRIPRLWRHSVL